LATTQCAIFGKACCEFMLSTGNPTTRDKEPVKNLEHVVQIIQVANKMPKGWITLTVCLLKSAFQLFDVSVVSRRVSTTCSHSQLVFSWRPELKTAIAFSFEANNDLVFAGRLR
jgi:hypothetical protein